jgi:hypothetical protein
MNRRTILKSMAAVTAAVSTPEALFPQARPRPEGDNPTPPDQGEEVALPVSMAEDAADPQTQFLSAPEMTTFRRLAEVIVPRTRTAGALDAGAPEFLDFYLAHSAADRQKLYRDGLARLEAEARRRFQNAFARLPDPDVNQLLGPLKEPWTPEPPADPLAAFLRAAKDDLWRATLCSRAWAARTEGRRRGMATGGGATYWYPVE